MECKIHCCSVIFVRDNLDIVCRRQVLPYHNHVCKCSTSCFVKWANNNASHSFGIFMCFEPFSCIILFCSFQQPRSNSGFWSSHKQKLCRGFLIACLPNGLEWCQPTSSCPGTRQLWVPLHAKTCSYSSSGVKVSSILDFWLAFPAGHYWCLHYVAWILKIGTYVTISSF